MFTYHFDVVRGDDTEGCTKDDQQTRKAVTRQQQGRMDNARARLEWRTGTGQGTGSPRSPPYRNRRHAYIAAQGANHEATNFNENTHRSRKNEAEHSRLYTTTGQVK